MRKNLGRGGKLLTRSESEDKEEHFDSFCVSLDLKKNGDAFHFESGAQSDEVFE